ncbi:hypothetical protein Tco_0858853 [Tanacetum coccineum]|uniref:Uncharacterized protein n=1 Tax=Tanacetum coccineum TaxID=301880 RepID=A0ABQ5BAC0_9ASTR
MDYWSISSTARQSTITPRTLNFNDEAGPSSPIRPTQNIEPEEQFKVDEVLADISLNISRPRGLSIPGPIQPQPQQPSQATDPKKIKKRRSCSRIPIKDFLQDLFPNDSEREKQMLKERDEKRLLRKRKATISEEQPSKKLKLRTETIDELRNYLRIVDFEKITNRESTRRNLMITRAHRLILLGDLTTIWETFATSNDDFWKNQEDWEIVRWRLNESSGVHTLELEDGTMIHMLAERRYPLSRELMIRMLEHGMEVEDESEIAIALIHLFILWTTEDGDDS